MKKKRILYIESNIDGTVGGSYFSLLFLIEGLDRNNYEPIVVFYQSNYLIPRYKKAGCKVLLIKKIKPFDVVCLFPILKAIENYSILRFLVLAPFKIFQKIFNYVFTFLVPSFKCWFLLKKEKIDLIHLNNTLGRPQEWILASIFTKSKVIAHQRGVNSVFPPQTLFWARHLRAIICISNAVKNNLLDHGFSKEILFKIYNGLDPDKFTVCRCEADVLKEFQIANGTPLIGIVGNIKEWKGQETVIRAVTYVKESYPNIRCFIVGDVSKNDLYYFNLLKAIVKDNNLQNNILFTGLRKDVPDLVNSFSVLIHASIRPEPFGRTLLEGMALRKPIISTRIGAPIEIVIDGETGILVSPGNAEELATAILKLLSTPILAEEMGKVGYERLLKEFSLRKNCEHTENLYDAILS